MFYDWDAIDEAGNLTGVSLLVSISLIVLFVQRLVSKAQITSTVYFKKKKKNKKKSLLLR